MIVERDTELERSEIYFPDLLTSVRCGSNYFISTFECFTIRKDGPYLMFMRFTSNWTNMRTGSVVAYS